MTNTESFMLDLTFFTTLGLVILLTLDIIGVTDPAHRDYADRQQLHYKTVVEDCNDDGLFRYHDTFYVCRQVMTADTVHTHSGE